MNDGHGVSVNLAGTKHHYEIAVGPDLLAQTGEWARRSLPATSRRIVIVSNAKVFGLFGSEVVNSLRSAALEPAVFLMGDGERFKSLATLNKLLAFLGHEKTTRADAIIALGGGVVGDLAGFAAAVYLRGLPFLQIPTTLLSMIDSSVGGKTGVNTSFGKNLVGAFHQPHGVLVDVSTLATLAPREVVAGFCEAVKHGAISGLPLLTQTGNFLDKYRRGKWKAQFSDSAFLDDFASLLSAQIAFKAEIVMNDEREDTSRIDGRSRKILNFGHTLAHALEKVTNYRYFKHGEAVGYGILFASQLSKNVDLLDVDSLNLLSDVVRSAGPLPSLSNIRYEEVIQAFSFDKKKIGSSLQFVLLEGIGRPVIKTDALIGPDAVSSALATLLHHVN